MSLIHYKTGVYMKSDFIIGDELDLENEMFLIERDEKPELIGQKYSANEFFLVFRGLDRCEHCGLENQLFKYQKSDNTCIECLSKIYNKGLPFRNITERIDETDTETIRKIYEEYKKLDIMPFDLWYWNLITWLYTGKLTENFFNMKDMKEILMTDIIKGEL